MTNIVSLQYFDGRDLKVWREVPYEGTLTIFNNAWYRIDAEKLGQIEIFDQGIVYPWIVDILVRKNAALNEQAAINTQLLNQLPVIREAMQRVDELEKILFTFGTQIVTHFARRRNYGGSGHESANVDGPA